MTTPQHPVIDSRVSSLIEEWGLRSVIQAVQYDIAKKLKEAIDDDDADLIAMYRDVAKHLKPAEIAASSV